MLILFDLKCVWKLEFFSYLSAIKRNYLFNQEKCPRSRFILLQIAVCNLVWFVYFWFIFFCFVFCF